MSWRRWFPETVDEWIDQLATLFLVLMAILFFGGALAQILFG